MKVPAPFDSGPHAVTTERDVIRATGPDTEAFLQGQLSQDVASIAIGASAYSFLLAPQGKVVAWLRVNRLGEDSFVLDVDAQFGEITLARLNRFKLRTHCELSLERWQMISVRGPQSLDRAIGDGSGAQIVSAAPWPIAPGVDLLGPRLAKVEAVTEATPADLERLRIMAGVPAMGSELAETTIPNETGVVQVSVSFTKGCFTGQELVARIDSRGANVARYLRGVRLEGPTVVGADIVVDDDVVGAVTSASGNVALAYVKRSVDSLPAVAVVDGVGATVHELAPMTAG